MLSTNKSADVVDFLIRPSYFILPWRKQASPSRRETEIGLSSLLDPTTGQKSILRNGLTRVECQMFRSDSKKGTPRATSTSTILRSRRIARFFHAEASPEHLVNAESLDVVKGK